jgi:hypothetical protein
MLLGIFPFLPSKDLTSSTHPSPREVSIFFPVMKLSRMKRTGRLSKF